AYQQADSNFQKLSAEALKCCYKFVARDRSVCEGLAAKVGWPKELLESAFSLFDQLKEADVSHLPGWNYSVEKEQKFISVSIVLPEGVEPTAVNIDLAPEKVCVVTCGYPDLVIDLPVPVQAAEAEPAKYKRSGRKFVLRLPT
ncbi:unnamed protein product, partial [Symbiodinium pilosum]